MTVRNRFSVRVPAGLLIAGALVVGVVSGCVSAQELFQKGVAEDASGNREMALSYYSQAIQADPAMAKAWNNRGLLYYKQRNLDEAERNLTEALKLKSDFAPALVNRGLVLEARGRRNEALASYEAAAKADARSPVALFNAGNLALRMGNPREAIGYLEAAIAIAPDEPDIRRAAARAWLEGGKPDKACDVYRAFYDSDAKDEEALAGLVRCSRAAGRTKEALEYAGKYSGLKPDCLACTNYYASLLMDARSPDRALMVLEKARGRFPADAGLRYRLALIYTGMNRREDAITQLEEYEKLRGDAKDAEAEAAEGLLRTLRKKK